MKKYSELKNQLKEWSKQIRFYKDHRKLDKRGDYSLSFLEYEILKLKWDFRHNHIAYCELHGKTREQIEKKFRHDEWWTPYINSKVKEIKLSLSVNMNAINSGN